MVQAASWAATAMTRTTAKLRIAQAATLAEAQAAPADLLEEEVVVVPEEVAEAHFLCATLIGNVLNGHLAIVA